jgi:hypothetical protein
MDACSIYFFTPFGISAQKTEIVCTISIIIFYEIVATLTPIMGLASIYEMTAFFA